MLKKKEEKQRIEREMATKAHCKLMLVFCFFSQ